MEFSHIPVLLKEAVDELIVDPRGIYVDGTVGGGGHSREICERLYGGGRLIAIDRDADAITAARKRLKGYGDRVVLIRANYGEMADILKDLSIDSVEGILLDLGVSSFQIDEPSRGFSYMDCSAPLDMRMNRDDEITAEEILAKYSAGELERIFRRYGEERFAGRIAEGIVSARVEKPIKTVGELNGIISEATPEKYRHGGSHPSKRVFQALRIEVNRELDTLEEKIDDMIRLLKPGGRICVITFHSLEDRIVKNAFKRSENPCICPPDFPICACGREASGRVITRRPICPTETEIKTNSRAKSAKLRVFEKKRAGEQTQRKKDITDKYFHRGEI